MLSLASWIWIVLSANLTDPVTPAVRLADSSSTALRARSVSILAPDHRSWQPASSLHFGACTSDVALRVALSAPHPGRWWWVSELRTPEDLRLSLGARALGRFGTSRSFAERPAKSLPITIPLDMHGGPETLSVTASDRQGDVLLDVDFVPDSAFPRRLQNAAARDAWVLGLLTMIVLVSLYLWKVVRERAFGWYVAYIATGMLWVTTKTGFAAALFWPDHPALNHAMPSFASRLSLVFFLLFLRDLLDLRRHFPHLGRVLDVGIAWQAGCAAFALSSIWLPEFHAGVLRHLPPELLEGPTLLLGLSLVTLRARRGDALAQRILISCLPLLLAALFGALWDPLHPDGIANLDTPVAIAGAILENLLTTWVLASEVRRRIVAHSSLLRDFDHKLQQEYGRYRSRIAADLHDDLSQRLMAARMALHVERTKGTACDYDPDRHLQDMAKAIRDVSHGLHLDMNRTSSFREALEDLARSMNTDDLHVSVDAMVERELLPAAGLEIYRVVQEALSNAVRHGRAKRVELKLRDLGALLEIRIRDDGTATEIPSSSGGLGIASMRSRMERLGGRLEILPTRGSGLTVRVRVPWERVAA